MKLVWSQPAHQFTAPAARSAFSSLSRSNPFLEDSTCTFAPVSFSHSAMRVYSGSYWLPPINLTFSV